MTALAAALSSGSTAPMRKEDITGHVMFIRALRATYRMETAIKTNERYDSGNQEEREADDEEQRLVCILGRGPSLKGPVGYHAEDAACREGDRGCEEAEAEDTGPGLASTRVGQEGVPRGEVEGFGQTDDCCNCQQSLQGVEKCQEEDRSRGEDAPKGEHESPAEPVRQDADRHNEGDGDESHSREEEADQGGRNSGKSLKVDGDCDEGEAYGDAEERAARNQEKDVSVKDSARSSREPLPSPFLARHIYPPRPN